MKRKRGILLCALLLVLPAARADQAAAVPAYTVLKTERCELGSSQAQLKAEEIPLRTGKILRGTIVGCVEPAVKLKTELGNIIEVPLSRISPEGLTNLPKEVAAPYCEIARLQSLIDEQTETFTQGLNNIRSIIEEAAEVETEEAAPPNPVAPIVPREGAKGPVAKNATARIVSDLEDYVQVSWRSDVYSARAAKANVLFRFIDSKGFVVAEAIEIDTHLNAGTTQVSGMHLMEKKVWNQVKRHAAVAQWSDL